MNIEHHNAGREAAKGPWASRMNGLLRLGEIRGMGSVPARNAREGVLSRSAVADEGQDSEVRRDAAVERA